MKKIEVSVSFIRQMQGLATKIRHLSADNDNLSSEYKDRADNPRSGDINTPDENTANSWIFHGESEAYSYVAGEIESILNFFGLSKDV